MIEGLKVTVKGGAVVELCQKQAGFHAEKMKFYQGQLEQYKNIVLPQNYSSSEDPKTQAERKIVEHEDKQRELLFIANHVNTNEEFLLGPSDLSTLGIRRSRF